VATIGTLIDTNVLLDIFTDNAEWGDWSVRAMETCAAGGPLYINGVIYAETSVRFLTPEAFERTLESADIAVMEIPRLAFFVAGKAFREYRRRGGRRMTLLPDFFIGAHAAVTGLTLLSRDAGRYRSYFPKLDIIAP
jgi:hypothetical protein